MKKNNSVQKALLVTKHKKEKVIAPLFLEKLGIEIVVDQNLDTDKFGTFTREIKRKDDQIETAIKKAKWGIENSEYTIAIASEGAFVPSPIPFFQANIEIVVFVDMENDIQIIGEYVTAETNIASQKVYSLEEARQKAKAWNFPENGIIVRKNKNLNYFIDKNIGTWKDFENSVNKLLNWPIFKYVYLETDMRANKNPIRMKAIEKATQNLIDKILSKCPKCNSPGFVMVESIKGLPCRNCKRETQQIKAEKYKCQKCEYEEIKELDKKFVYPENCNFCNR